MIGEPIGWCSIKVNNGTERGSSLKPNSTRTILGKIRTSCLTKYPLPRLEREYTHPYRVALSLFTLLEGVVGLVVFPSLLTVLPSFVLLAMVPACVFPPDVVLRGTLLEGLRFGCVF